MTDKSDTLPTLILHKTPAEFCAQVSSWVADILRRAIDARGEAYLVVSGGRTPVPVFEALAQQELPWRLVTLLLADERWVPPEHEASNTRMVEQHLLTGPAAAANFLRFPYSGTEVTTDAVAANHRLGEISGAFDVVLLGMGDDGHTASLFPCAPQLHAGLSGRPCANCLAVTPTEAPHARLSLTLPRLLNSRHLALLIQGQSKLEVYRKAVQNGDINEMPVRGVLQQHNVPVVVHWCS